MPTLLNFWCSLFGFATCKDASTFEAIILVFVTLGALSVMVAVVAVVIAAALEYWPR
jgi:hypothetical protein